ncbi:MAG: prenyltransferase [Betaproteobacteria bacterium]|nr:prenyltransferase [Betaproteobacteria bacterium]
MTPGVGDLLRIVDIRTKVVSISSLLVGSAWAHAKAPEQFSWTLLALLVAATLAIDMGTTGFNSYFDFRSGVDTRESDRERFKALVQRDIDPRVARDLSAVLFALAVPLGLAIGARAGWGVVAAGALGMLLGYLYSGGPHPISRTPVGEFFAGGLLGGVLVTVAACVHTQRLDAATVLLGLPASLIIAAILSTNNACDRVGDARAGGARSRSSSARNARTFPSSRSSPPPSPPRRCSPCFACFRRSRSFRWSRRRSSPGAPSRPCRRAASRTTPSPRTWAGCPSRSSPSPRASSRRSCSRPEAPLSAGR